MRRTFVLFALMLVMGGCTDNSQPAKEKAAEKKVATYRVTTRGVTNFIEATGSIQADTEGSAKVVSALAGAVENIFVKVGSEVKKGAPLASVISPDVSDAYSGYLSTLSQVKQAERIYNLNKQLFDTGAITKNDLILSEANYEQTKAVLEASKKKLEIYGVNPESAFTEKYLIKSPMNGSVVEIMAHIGDRVDTSNPLMLVADPDRIIVVANIYDTEISNIKKGKAVVFSTDIFPKILFKGVITYVSDSSDPETKTVKAYIRLTGSQQLFKHNMFIRMKIINGEKRLPVVPKTALFYRDGKFTVYLIRAGKYELVAVKPAFEVSEKLIAVEGLEEGDEVVLSAIALEKT